MDILILILVLGKIVITIDTYNTQQSYDLHLSLVQKSWGLHKLSFMAIKYWNALDKDLRDINYEQLFKSKLRNNICRRPERARVLISTCPFTRVVTREKNFRIAYLCFYIYIYIYIYTYIQSNLH